MLLEYLMLIRIIMLGEFDKVNKKTLLTLIFLSSNNVLNRFWYLKLQLLQLFLDLEYHHHRQGLEV